MSRILMWLFLFGAGILAGKMLLLSFVRIAALR